MTPFTPLGPSSYIPPEKALEQLASYHPGENASPPPPSPGDTITLPLVVTNRSITLSDYIIIPNTTQLIAKAESHKGKMWEQTHYDLLDQGLFMPSPAIFMPYFLAVKEAAQGRITLYDGNHNPLQKSEADDLCKYMTSGHRGGCWTWLDARFQEQDGVWTITTDHRVVMNGGKKELQGTASPLEACIRKDCFVNLTFNQQGLPTAPSSSSSYQQGTNIYYWHPRNNAVAGFNASSVRADLICNWDPRGSGSWLGVFACAAGAPKT